MKNLMKATIILGVILFSLSAIVGCKDTSKEYQGIYFNIDDHSQYIELEDDGVMVIRQRINRIGEWPPEYKETTGKWKVYGGEVVFIDPSGYEQRYKITRNSIRTTHTVWVKHGAASKTERNNIPEITMRRNETGGIDKTKADLTRAKMTIIENALARFYIDCERYPDDSEGLEVLALPPSDMEEGKWNGPYLKRSDLVDLWDNPYIYVAEGKFNPGSFDLISLGQDGVEGGEGDNQDIVNH